MFVTWTTFMYRLFKHISTIETDSAYFPYGFQTYPSFIWWFSFAKNNSWWETKLMFFNFCETHGVVCSRLLSDIYWMTEQAQNWALFNGQMICDWKCCFWYMNEWTCWHTLVNRKNLQIELWYGKKWIFIKIKPN